MKGGPTIEPRFPGSNVPRAKISVNSLQGRLEVMSLRVEPGVIPVQPATAAAMALAEGGEAPGVTVARAGVVARGARGEERTGERRVLRVRIRRTRDFMVAAVGWEMGMVCLSEDGKVEGVEIEGFILLFNDEIPLFHPVFS